MGKFTAIITAFLFIAFAGFAQEETEDGLCEDLQYAIEKFSYTDEVKGLSLGKGTGYFTYTAAVEGAEDTRVFQKETRFMDDVFITTRYEFRFAEGGSEEELEAKVLELKKQLDDCLLDQMEHKLTEGGYRYTFKSGQNPYDQEPAVELVIDDYAGERGVWIKVVDE